MASRNVKIELWDKFFMSIINSSKHETPSYDGYVIYGNMHDSILLSFHFLYLLTIRSAHLLAQS